MLCNRLARNVRLDSILLVLSMGLGAVNGIATAQVRPVGPLNQTDGSGPHIVIIAGDAEYGSRTSMAAFAHDLREKFNFEVTLIESMVGVLENPDNPDKALPNLQVLDDADLLVMYIRMRIPPQEQLDRLDAYFKSGRPAIGIRTTTHAFTNDRGWNPRYFGGHYWRHDGPNTETFALPHMNDHPVLRGVPRHEANGSTLYISSPLSDTAQALVMGRFDDTAPPQPFAWVNEYVEGSRQFFLTAGHPEDIALPGNQALLYNAVFWTLGLDVPLDGVLNPRGDVTPTVTPPRYPAPPGPGPVETAIHLFEGTDLSAWDTSFGAKEPQVFGIDGRAHSGAGLPEFDGARWPVRDGYVEATPGYGDIVSREEFADIELHLDFMIPLSPGGVKRIWKGNSGVFVNGRYEIQILDSRNETESDENSCGAINGLIAPSANASRAAGEWQSLDVYFRAARYAFGEKTDKARMTVLLNGEEIHDNVELARPTVWGFPEDGIDGPLSGPVRLQADSSRVRFANVWVRPLSPMEVAKQLPSPPRLTGTKWADIDFGPSKTFSLQVSEDNIAYKGLAVRLDEGLGGISSGTEFMIFDTDTLRWAGGWSGPGFNDWRGIALNGQHEIHPSIVGDLLFANPVLPGWGRPSDGSFTDERVLGRDGLRYGPLAREWGHWNGHYIHGGKVVLSYSVGGTEILEMAGSEGPWSKKQTGATGRVMTRTLNLGPRTHPLTLQVAREEGASIVVEEVDGLKTARFVLPAQDGVARSRSRVAFRGRTSLEIANFDDKLQGDFSIYARIKSGTGGTVFSFAPESGPWAKNSRALFVRNGHLVFDVGWVGEIVSRRQMSGGEWHDVAMTYDHATGDVRLYIDGRLDGKKRLKPTDQVEDPIVRIGFASPDFPRPSYFQGAISEVRFYTERLGSDDMAGLGESVAGSSLAGRWVVAEQRGDTIPNSAGRGHDARIVGGSGAPSAEVVVAVRDGGAGAKFIGVAGENGVSDLRLTIPPGDDPLRLTLFIGRASQERGLDAFMEVVRSSENPADLAPLTEGGPTHWTEKLVTRGELGSDDGAYAIDTITHPIDNPYRSWLRFGGFDFFEDDSRAAICTWSGDVWIVDGISESLETLTWQRVASGMFQPLGLAIVDGDIYVLCRDQITVLRDLNGDGETDFYENFNNDHQVTEHFHEFALDLKFATDGNFYYTKGGRHGADSITPNHGTLIRVSRDGRKSEFVANGFRAPNGLGLGPAGEILIADNQGHWTPANRINWIKPGGFYGYMWGYHEGQTINGFDEPLCWIHNEVDRSPGTFAWVPDYRWGPLRGHIISASYGMGQIFHVLHEEIDGVRQGGVVKFPLEFETGVTRAKFRKRDGQLYLAGLFGWSSNKTQPGAFYRVRYTGKSIYMPEDLHIASDGVALTFTDPLDPDSATDPGNYGISHWNYKWREQYGSPDYKMDGTEGRDELRATWAALSTDRRTVYLEIPGIRKVMQMQILVNIRAADGAEVRHRIQHTVHKLGHRSVRDLSGQTGVSGRRRPASSPGATTQGLAQTIVSRITGAKDTRASRLAALFVAEGEPPSPFVPPGPFRSTWSGYIEVDLNGPYRFSVEGNGESELTVNDNPALEGNEVALRQGLNRIELLYDSPRRGPSEFRLYWESRWLAREPVPPTMFARPESIPELDEGARNRAARNLVAQYRCLNCHAPEPGALKHGMPELRADAPALDRVGEKYNESWLVERILDPESQRSDSVMPRLLHGSDEKRNREEAAHIAKYLMALSRPAKGFSPLRELRDRGEALYNDLGCFTCHQLTEEDTLGEGQPRRSLEGIQYKWRGGSLVEYLLDPHRDYTHNPMPNFGLSEDEARALAQYLISSTAPRTNPPATVRTESGDSDTGRELLESRGCLNCHSVAGHSTTLTTASLSALRDSTMHDRASNDAGCLADTAEGRGGAPEFDLTDRNRSVLRSFIAKKSDSLFRFDPAEYAERQFEALSCLACHARDGAGDRWSLFMPEGPETDGGNPSEDDDDIETIHLRRPRLDFAGEKLRTGWMRDFLAGRLGYKPRPGLTARMPAFPAQAEDIARGLAAQHGFPPLNEDRSPVDSVLAATGRSLALSDDLFRCNSCHSVGADGPLAGPDMETINFAHIPDRLRRGYFDRFTLTPQRILPGTQMPQYAMDDGTSSIPHILDGDMGRQFDAIWHFMRSLDDQDSPD